MNSCLPFSLYVCVCLCVIVYLCVRSLAQTKTPVKKAKPAPKKPASAKKPAGGGEEEPERVVEEEEDDDEFGGADGLRKPTASELLSRSKPRDGGA